MVNNTGGSAALLQPRTVLVPLLNLSVATELVHLAAALVAGMDGLPPADGRVVVLGVVEVPPDSPLSDGMNIARAYRALLSFLPNEVPIEPAAGGAACTVPVQHMVRVAHGVAEGIRDGVGSTDADLLLLHWKGYTSDPTRYSYGHTIDDLMAAPPTNILLARPGGWEVGRRIFVPVRGGPAAELALDISVVLARRLGAALTVMHSVPRSVPLDPAGRAPVPDTPAGARLRGDEPYLALAARLDRMQAERLVPLEQVLTVADDVGAAVAQEARPTDLVILGAPGVGTGEDPALHPVVGRVLDAPGRPVLLVRARTALDLASYQRRLGPAGTPVPAVISAEQWFVENTYHADEFKKLATWQELKEAHHTRVSVVVPVLNEGARVVRLLKGLQHALLDDTALADEIVVVDGGALDNTRERVREAGFPVLTLAEAGAYPRLGPAAWLWWTLDRLSGDLIVWLDPSAGRLNTRLVPMLTAPLLTDPEVRLVKPFWTQAAEEGARFARVTADDLLTLSSAELAALPMRTWVRVFFPGLGALVEPVSRVFAARRALLEEILPGDILQAGLQGAGGMVFYAALVLETAARHSTRAIAQVEMPRQSPRHERTPTLSADLRQLRQVRELLGLFAARPETVPHQETLYRLQSHLAHLVEL